MSTELNILVDTWLKQGTVPSSTLKDSEKVAVKAGTKLACNWVKATGDHQMVSLVNAQKGKHNYYAYDKHVQVLVDGKPVTKLPITKEQAEVVLRSRISDDLYGDLVECLQKFDITTTARIRHFLAQVGHESAGLIYSQELASGRAYEGRRDLGNTQPGDGVKFKGAGFIQLTGRANYQALADYLGDPEVVKQGCPYVATRYPFTSAGFWWYKNGLNKMIDAGATVQQVSFKVNGGWNGINDRIAYFQRAEQVV